jgi:Ca2+:H+ antiporter
LHFDLSGSLPPRTSLHQKFIPGALSAVPRTSESSHRSPSNPVQISGSSTDLPRATDQNHIGLDAQAGLNTSERRVSYAIPSTSHVPAAYAPVLESVDQAIKSTDLQSMQLPNNMTRDDFTRAVAVATVSALRHQEAQPNMQNRIRTSAGDVEVGGEHGGHDAPSWSRVVSASVLLSCTALYAVIAGQRKLVSSISSFLNFCG